MGKMKQVPVALKYLISASCLGICLVLWLIPAHPRAASASISSRLPPLLQEQEADQLAEFRYSTQEVTFDPITLTTQIVIRAVGNNFPLVTTTLSLENPATWPQVLAMRSHEPSEDEYFTAVGSLPTRFFSQAQTKSPPTLQLDEGRARISLTQTATLYSYEYLSPLIDAIDVSKRNGAVMFHINRGDTPLTTTWKVDLVVDGMRAVTTSVLPLSDDGNGHLAWLFNAEPPDLSTASSVPSSIALQVAPETKTQIRLMLSGNFWWFLQGVLQSVVPIVILILLSIYLPKASTGNLSRKLRRTLVPLLVLLPVTSFVFGLHLYFPELFNFLAVDFFQLEAYFNSLFLVAAGIFFYVTSRFLGHTNGSIVILLVAGGLISLNLVAYFSTQGPTDRYTELVVWTLFLMQVTYFAFAGLLRYVLAFRKPMALHTNNAAPGTLQGLQSGSSTHAQQTPPQDTAAHISAADRLPHSKGPTTKWYLNLAIIVLSLVTLAQVLWSEYERTRTWFATTDLESVFPTLEGAVTVFLFNFMWNFLALLPVAGLLGLVFFFRGHVGDSEGLLLSKRTRWVLRVSALLYAGLVVGISGYVFDFLFPVAFITSLVVLHIILDRRWKLWQGVQDAVARLNPGLEQPGDKIIEDHREEFLKRTWALDDLDRKTANLYDELTKGVKDLTQYNSSIAELQTERTRLVRGDNCPDVMSESSEEVQKPAPVTPARPAATVCLPSGTSPRELVLALGPKNSWWANGNQAWKFGIWLASVPLGYFLYVLLTQRAYLYFSPTAYFGILNLITELVQEAAFWLAASFLMGCIYPYLPGRNGILKGVTLSLVYFVAYAANGLVSYWAGLGVSTSWTFRYWQLLLFLLVLGILMDLQALRDRGIYWRHLFDLYQIRNLQFLVSYLSPVALAVFAISQQVLSGAAQGAITELIKSFPTFLPK